jgi:hypothetical protein
VRFAPVLRVVPPDEPAGREPGSVNGKVRLHRFEREPAHRNELLEYRGERGYTDLGRMRVTVELLEASKT